MRENLPRKNLDVLFDIARFRIGKAHDDSKESFAVCFGLCDRERPESFEVTADAVLFLNSKTDVYKLFQ